MLLEVGKLSLPLGILQDLLLQQRFVNLLHAGASEGVAGLQVSERRKVSDSKLLRPELFIKLRRLYVLDVADKLVLHLLDQLV